MNVKRKNLSIPRHRSVSFTLFGLVIFIQACAAPLPQIAYPVESKIATALGTTEFIITSKIKYTNGCRLFSLVGCYTDYWQACILFNNVAAFKTGTKNDYKGPDTDLNYAANSQHTMMFRDNEWYYDLGGTGCTWL
jgi:hypothetical protein